MAGKHRYGTYRPKFKDLKVGDCVRVVLGLEEREVEARICGPVRVSDLYCKIYAQRVYVRQVLIRVEGEKELRDIDFDRIVAVLPRNLNPNPKE